MSDNEHATYFGQPATLERTTGENEGGASQTLSVGSSGRSTGPVEPRVQIGGNSVPPTMTDPKKDLFRASLISKMDNLIRDFWEDKTS
jgi:hypothetical protein